VGWNKLDIIQAKKGKYENGSPFDLKIPDVDNKFHI
jgi:hypothetical protein